MFVSVDVCPPACYFKLKLLLLISVVLKPEVRSIPKYTHSWKYNYNYKYTFIEIFANNIHIHSNSYYKYIRSLKYLL